MSDIDQYLVDLKCKIIKYGLEYEINNLTDQINNLKINIAMLKCKNKRLNSQLIEKDNYIKNLKYKYRYHFSAVYRERNFYRSLYEKSNEKNYKNICKYLLQNNKKSVNDNCAICLCSLDDEVFTLPCNHSFHFDCYCKIKNDKCPLCRKESIFS